MKVLKVMSPCYFCHFFELVDFLTFTRRIIKSIGDGLRNHPVDRIDV